MRKIALLLGVSLLLAPAAFASDCHVDRVKGDKGSMLKWIDTAQDGKITKGEYLKAYEKKFDKIDLNKDGVLDESELKASAEKWQEKKAAKKKD